MLFRSIHADCEQEPELFRLAFGMHLFGDGNYFPASKGKYTLEPLKAGRAVLACAGIDGLEDITLKELEFRGHGPALAAAKNHPRHGINDDERRNTKSFVS